MTKKSNQKIKLLLLYELLSRLTDEEHALSAPEIIQLMKDEDVTVTRKILMSDIELLNLYGYEICTYKKKSWYYYVRSAKLELEQVWKLIDLVSVSNLERRQKSLLFEKLVSMVNCGKAELLAKNIVYSNTSPIDNYIIYNIEKLDAAISARKKVSFTYYTLDENKRRVYRRDGEKFVVNPLLIICDKCEFRLVCYDEHNKGLVYYRIDKMDCVRMEETPVAVRAQFADFSAETYRKKGIHILAEKSENVELKFDGSLLEDVFDKFGEEIDILKSGENEYRTTVRIRADSAFFAWVVSSRGKVTVEAPSAVKERFDEFVQEIKKQY